MGFSAAARLANVTQDCSLRGLAIAIGDLSCGHAGVQVGNDWGCSRLAPSTGRLTFEGGTSGSTSGPMVEREGTPFTTHADRRIAALGNAVVEGSVYAAPRDGLTSLPPPTLSDYSR